MSPVQRLSPEEMERKFEELDMRSVINQCTPRPIPRDHRNPVKKKREHIESHVDAQGEIRVVISHFEDPDGSPRRSIRYMKADDGSEFEPLPIAPLGV